MQMQFLFPFEMPFAIPCSGRLGITNIILIDLSQNLTTFQLRLHFQQGCEFPGRSIFIHFYPAGDGQKSLDDAGEKRPT